MTATKNPFESVELSIATQDAIQAATETVEGRRIGTIDLLFGLLDTEKRSVWDEVQLKSTFVIRDECADYPDANYEEGGSWNGVPLTVEATRAMAIAAEISREYGLSPIPTGALALGLVASADSGAARALLADKRVDHADLLELIHDCTLDATLENLDLLDAAKSARSRRVKLTRTLLDTADKLAQSNAAVGIKSEAPTTRIQADFVAAVMARAQSIDGTTDPTSIALLVASLELNQESELRELFDSMLLDPDSIRMLQPALDHFEDLPAADAIVRSRRRFDTDLLAAEIITGVALLDSPRVRELFRRLALTNNEVAAQSAEWPSRREGKPEVANAEYATTVLAGISGAVVTMLIVLDAIDTGDWWKVPLVYLIWTGYPGSGPRIGLIYAGLFTFVVNPVAGLAQAISAGISFWQQHVEIRVRLARTGVKLNGAEQRRVSQRFLTDRSRRRRTRLQMFRKTFRSASRRSDG
ncbi:MAG: hypothetical protein JHC98_05940 [Thermoleophilaceae bacterium]|nr:hypothetical protein [Thermoleophilaceae bacterium]